MHRIQYLFELYQPRLLRRKKKNDTKIIQRCAGPLVAATRNSRDFKQLSFKFLIDLLTIQFAIHFIVHQISM